MTSALDVKNGDVLNMYGHRVRVSNVEHFETERGLTARYKLTSEPNAEYPKPLPPGYEGMQSGGNRLAAVGILESLQPGSV